VRFNNARQRIANGGGLPWRACRLHHPSFSGENAPFLASRRMPRSWRQRCTIAATAAICSVLLAASGAFRKTQKNVKPRVHLWR